MTDTQAYFSGFPVPPGPQALLRQRFISASLFSVCGSYQFQLRQSSDTSVQEPWAEHQGLMVLNPDLALINCGRQPL